MARFDWPRFLRSRRIDYEESAARQVAVQCPFCGPDHTDHRVSINLDGRGWRCWRQPHLYYGRSPVTLVAALVGCSAEEARRIVGGPEASAPPPVGRVLENNLARLRGRPAACQAPRRLTLPRGVRPLDTSPRAGPFWAYLQQRGFRPSESRWVAEYFDLHYATTGPWAWRLIFPVRDRRGELLTWTARAVGASTDLRYKQPKKSEVLCEAPKTILGLDRLWSAPSPRVLVVVEGPMDAARISASGAPLGVWGTCLFGLAVSDEQCALLEDLSDHFPRLALLLDPGAEAMRLRVVRRLRPLTVALPELPPDVADPGELTAAQATSLCLDLLGD